MADTNILARYGIKEVADVTFYSINDDGSPKVPVLYLDTLKVTTIEQTAETTEARGGKGNAALIAWDYGKEINVTIEDALFSAKSMAIMFGNGAVKGYNTTNSNNAYIMKTEQFIAHGDGGADATAAEARGWNPIYTAPDGHTYTKQNPKFFTADSEVVTAFADGEAYFCSFDLLVAGSVIEISANSFPGTYYVTGDTFARSETTGEDEFFQFIIPRAKVQSENTITLEAEGDPSVFNMNLKVLRPADGIMMKLVKYELYGDGGDPAEVDSEIYHNHYLDPANTDGDNPAVGIKLTIGGEAYTIAKPTAAGTNTVTWTPAFVSRTNIITGANGDAGAYVVTPAATGDPGTATVVAAWNGGETFYNFVVEAGE